MSTNLATVVADFEVQLSTQLDIGGTTATLSSATDDDGVALPAGNYFFTLDGSNSQKEHIFCTLSGTSLTGIKSVSRQGVQTTGSARLHRIGASVVITDYAHLYYINRLIGGNAQLNSALPLEYDGTATINSANQLTTVAYVLSVVNGGAVSFNAIVEEAIGGETIVAGNLLYFSETDNEWMKTDADLLATLFNVKLGIAMGSGSNGVAITGGVLTRGLYTTSGLTQGDILFASNTAGGITNAAGTVPRVIGIAKDTTHIYFDPDFQNVFYDYVVSATGNDTYTATMPGALSVPFVGMKVKLKVDVANTGSCSFNGKTIKKDVSVDLVTGDILASQIIELIYDGTNYQLVSNIPTATPIVNRYTTTTKIGSSSTRFDITNITGNTYRYTYDGTGTDPNINSGTFPIGSAIDFNAQNFNSANNGFFLVTGVGANYVEVTNASGVAENDKTIGTGAVQKGTAWTKPVGLKYITVEVQAGGGAGGGGSNAATGGGAGGGAGGYSRKVIPASSLASSEYFVVGKGSAFGGETATRSIFSVTSLITANGGTNGSTSSNDGGAGGTATGGDYNTKGGGGSGGGASPGSGGSSPLGTGGNARAGSNPQAGNNGGAGGGTHGQGVGNTNGGDGGDGVIILTEYY